MISLTIRHQYSKEKNLQLDLDVQLPMSGINMIYGHSGTGKTTLLKCIAGIEKPRIARIAVGETILLDTRHSIDVAAHKRNIGYLMQGSQLFPQLTVLDNLLYAVKRANKCKSAGREAFIDIAEAIDFFSLTSMLHHYPHQLSGGEQQRVAIARVLLSNPSLLLFDEAMTALDNPMQGKILAYLKKIQHLHKIPMIFVTHAIKDLVAAAHHVLILEAGKVVAQGEFQSMIVQQAFTRLLGETRLLEGQVISHDLLLEHTVISWNNKLFTVPLLAVPIGNTVRLWQYYSDKQSF